MGRACRAASRRRGAVVTTPRVNRYVYEEAQRVGVAPAAILGRDRTATVCLARWRVMKRLRADMFSMTQIGEWFGRDHSTVSHGLRTDDDTFRSIGEIAAPIVDKLREQAK